jgi:hypothetical protein
MMRYRKTFLQGQRLRKAGGASAGGSSLLENGNEPAAPAAPCPGIALKAAYTPAPS